MAFSAAWLLRYALSVTGVLLSVLGYAAVVPNGLLAVAALVLSCAFLIHVRNNRLLLLVGIVFAYLCYSILFVNYLSPLLTTVFTRYRSTPEAGVALSALLLFISCLLLFMPDRIVPFGEGQSLVGSARCNAVFEVVLLIVLGLILVFGFGRPDAIGEDRGSPSALYEYSMILFLLGYYFAGSHKGWIVTFSVLLGLYALQNIVYGGRVTALQLLLILFFCTLNKKTSTKVFVSAIVFGLLAFTLLGAIRTGLAHAGLSDYLEALSDSLSRGFTWDTAYSSWHTSVTFILYGGIIPRAEHLRLFGQWAKSVVLGGSVPMCNLANLTLPYFYHCFGGVLPVFFQFYLGPIGVIVASFYVSVIIRFISKACEVVNPPSRVLLTPAIGIVSMYVSTSCFRWILYSPSQITRGLLLCLLCSLLLFWLDRQMQASGLDAAYGSPIQDSLSKNSKR
ncbi:hypothetical protein ACQRAP_06205 [Collinsella sp. SGI.180]|uniref:hypothetical protein n=1 Tax=Collinsella sp. SGI.180 TaxID=3420555 RepID=UPI003CFCF6E3